MTTPTRDKRIHGTKTPTENQDADNDAMLSEANIRTDPLNQDIKWQELHFSFNRFWSSPEKLPLRNVIGVVLNNPNEVDIIILCKHFGSHTVLRAFNEMRNKNELAEAQQNIILEVFKNNHIK